MEINLKIGIIEPDCFGEGAIAQLSQFGLVSRFEGDNLEGFVCDLDVIFIRLGYQIDKTFLNNCHRLKYLCSPTTGHNHIDEEELQKRGIKLVSLRGERDFLESIQATPEHTFGLILSLLRNYKMAFTHVSEGKWNRDQLRGEELNGKTVGIIGLGRVGYRIATYCNAFEAKVAYCDTVPNANAQNWDRISTISELIKKSDVVVLSASHDEQPPIICQSEIDLLAEKYFVNTSRGELVDENALMNAIEGGEILGVAVDVIASEAGSNQLARWREIDIKNSNLIITPHIGGATYDSMLKTELFVVEKLKKTLNLK